MGALWFCLKSHNGTYLFSVSSLKNSSFTSVACSPLVPLHGYTLSLTCYHLNSITITFFCPLSKAKKRSSGKINASRMIQTGATYAALWTATVLLFYCYLIHFDLFIFLLGAPVTPGPPPFRQHVGPPQPLDRLRCSNPTKHKVLSDFGNLPGRHPSREAQHQMHAQLHINTIYKQSPTPVHSHGVIQIFP